MQWKLFNSNSSLTCDTQQIKCFHLSGEPVLSMTGNNFDVYVFCDSGEFGQKINSDDIVQWPEI